MCGINAPIPARNAPLHHKINIKWNSRHISAKQIIKTEKKD
jgi:hypothetical protein